MTHIEAMKQALEALENNRQTHHYCEDTWYSCPKHEEGCANDSEGHECNCGADKANAEIDDAITSLRVAIASYSQAIAEAEKAQHEKPVAFITNRRQRMNVEIKPNAFVWMPTTTDWEIPLYAGYPQPKAEQFDHQKAAQNGLREAMNRSQEIAKAAQPKAEQEPVAEIVLWRGEKQLQWDKSLHVGTKFYTSPQPQKPLTEWKPIQTAPKDTEVLLYCNKFIPFYIGKKRYGGLGEPQQDEFVWRCSSSGRFANPTYWMPLPKPPIEAAHGIKGEA